MKLQPMMTKRKPNLYLFPGIILCLHLMFAVSGFYLSEAFQVDLDAREAEYEEARNRLPLIRETQLNKDFILRVMATNVETSRIFVDLFKILAAVGALVSVLSAMALVQVYRQRGEQD